MDMIVSVPEFTYLLFNGSNIFGIMEIRSRYGQFEPLKVNLSSRAPDQVAEWK